MADLAAFVKDLDHDETKEKALASILKASHTKNKLQFLFGTVVPKMISFLQDKDSSPTLKENAACLLWYLSRELTYATSFRADPVLYSAMKVVFPNSTSLYKRYAFLTFRELFVESLGPCYNAFLSDCLPDFAFLPVLVLTLSDDDHNVVLACLKSLHPYVTRQNRKNIPILVSEKNLIAEVLRCSEEGQVFVKDAACSLLFFLSFTLDISTLKSLTNQCLPSLLSSLPNTRYSERLFSISLAIANMIGKEEGSQFRVPHVTISLLKQRISTAVQKGNKFDVYLQVPLDDLLHVCARIAVNPENRNHLATEEFTVTVLMKILGPGPYESEMGVKQLALDVMNYISLQRTSHSWLSTPESLSRLYSYARNEVFAHTSSGILFSLLGNTSHKTQSAFKPDPKALRVMISYSWSHQVAVLALVATLRAQTDISMELWIDVERMQGDVMQAMANAVDEANLLLVFFSLEYKESANCQRELQYAVRQNKPIIYIQIQEEYRPDGWLGLLMCDSLYVKFQKCQTEPTVTEILRILHQSREKNQTLSGSVPQRPTLLLQSTSPAITQLMDQNQRLCDLLFEVQQLQNTVKEQRIQLRQLTQSVTEQVSLNQELSLVAHRSLLINQVVAIGMLLCGVAVLTPVFFSRP
eukprot:Lithocolla_globosa_v1_NODE_1419_length_2591_cov_7.666009.p1 type:complete len:640 gc:universal NODE_1419_length_2591_cov_7.666009:2066-147(-)